MFEISDIMENAKRLNKNFPFLLWLLAKRFNKDDMEIKTKSG